MQRGRGAHVRVLLAIFLSATASATLAQDIRIGPEIQVNTYTTESQRHPSLATDPSGGFVVTWAGWSGAGQTDVFARRYDPSGFPTTSSEFQVNDFTASHQVNSSIASGANGRMITAWTSNLQDGGDSGIFATTETGFPSEFQVNTYAPGSQNMPDVAVDAGDRFIVVWESEDQDGSATGIFGQRYDASVLMAGGEFRVNTYTTGWQQRPSIAVDGQGNFVVVWLSGGQEDYGFQLFGQRYDASGVTQGGEFRIGADPTRTQWRTDVAADADGNFVVVWGSRPIDGVHDNVWAQRYDAHGTPQGLAFRVHSETMGDHDGPAVAFDAGGGFLVVWERDMGDIAERRDPDVWARRFDASGAPVGEEFQVNTYTTKAQGYPSVDFDEHGRFVVAWDSELQDGSGSGIFAQRFAPDLVFADGFEDDGPQSGFPRLVKPAVRTDLPRTP